jgi:hypothetical protein
VLTCYFFFFILIIIESPIPQSPAKCFVDGVVAKGWKFNPQAQQIHDNSYSANPALYKTLKETAQIGCKEKNF